MGIIFNLNQNDHVSSRVTPVVSIEICNNTRSDYLLLKVEHVLIESLDGGKCPRRLGIPLRLYEEACASPSSRRESWSQTGVKADFSPCSVEKPMNSDCSQIRPVIRD